MKEEYINQGNYGILKREMNEISGDIKEIIAKRNKEIGELKTRDSNLEKYFIMMEANIPLFQGFNNVF